MIKCFGGRQTEKWDRWGVCVGQIRRIVLTRLVNSFNRGENLYPVESLLLPVSLNEE